MIGSSRNIGADVLIMGRAPVLYQTQEVTTIVSDPATSRCHRALRLLPATRAGVFERSRSSVRNGRARRGSSPLGLNFGGCHYQPGFKTTSSRAFAY